MSDNVGKAILIGYGVTCKIFYVSSERKGKNVEEFIIEVLGAQLRQTVGAGAIYISFSNMPSTAF